MVSHIPEPLAKIIFPLMKCWEILEIKVEISVARELLLKVLGYWEAALKYLPHFMFIEEESINFTSETLSRTQMLDKGKNKAQNIIKER